MISFCEEPGYFNGTALGYRLDDGGFQSRKGLEIFLFTTASRPVLRPYQPPIQWIPGDLSLGIKRPRRETDHSPPSGAEVKNAWSYTSTSPIRLHGVVLRDNFTFHMYLKLPMHVACASLITLIVSGEAYKL
jgi:hypothetical protein